MTFFRRTCVAALLFGLVSTSVWWPLFDWTIARRQLLLTILLTPVVWWLVVGRVPRPRLWRGALGGALAGLVSQTADLVRDVFGVVSRRGTIHGVEGFAAMAVLATLLLTGFLATAGGALVGLIALGVQRAIDGDVTISW